MKVIQIMDSFIVTGGVNSFVYDLCFALKDAGCDVSLIGILDWGFEGNPVVSRLQKEGIRVECIGASSKRNAILHHVGKLRKTIAELSGEEPTICNLHLKLGVLMGTLSTRGLANIKCIETYHSEYHKYHLQCWMCNPFIEKYITVSQTAKEEMHRRFLTPYERIAAIANGVSRERIRKASCIDNAETKTDEFRVVSVGRMSYEKNFAVPVSAFVDVCNEKVTYTLIGGGPQEAEIKAIADKNKYITMLGEQSRECTLQELAKADVVVMPSLWEGRSILQLEAMALDKPMILSDVPGLREPFGEEGLKEGEACRMCKFGYLVETSNEAGYCEALNDLVNNRGRLSDMKKEISAVSMKNDIKNTAQEYIRVYNSVL